MMFPPLLARPAALRGSLLRLKILNGRFRVIDGEGELLRDRAVRARDREDELPVREDVEVVPAGNEREAPVGWLGAGGRKRRLREQLVHATGRQGRAVDLECLGA